MRFSQKDTIYFLEKLEMYLGSGLALNQALRIIADGTTTKQQIVFERVIANVESGGLLSKSLAELKLAATLIGMIEHGESAGKLLEALALSRSLLERQDELKKKCLSALLYPCVIGLFACLLTIGLIRGVMPQIIPMLKSLNVSLPLLTRIVMAVSEGFLTYGAYVCAGLTAALIIISFAYRRSFGFRSFSQSTILITPIVGGLIRSYHISTFMRSCGSLVDSGLPITTAYERTSNTVSLLPFRKNLLGEILDINRGVRLSNIFVRLNISKFASSLVAAGETSGSLGSSLLKVATIIDRDVEHMLKRLTALVEPLMMICMGLVVGAIALSIMMPIYDISRVLQK